jgi:hypothetical protein
MPLQLVNQQQQRFQKVDEKELKINIKKRKHKKDSYPVAVLFSR